MANIEIISKINEFEFLLNQKLTTWLQKKLPPITREWWKELVVNNLTDMQKVQLDLSSKESCSKLDLAASLRVIDRNWYVITSQYFINKKYRNYVKDMQRVRNDWAHITPEEISKNKIESDIQTIINLLEVFDATQQEISTLEQFLLSVKNNVKIVESKSKLFDPMPVAKTPIKTEIVPGTMVVLVSNEQEEGAVIAVDGDKYTVYINNQIKSFYREQLKLKPLREESKQVSLERMRVALTAHQINNPSAHNLYSLNAARIDFVPYQFRPALKMIKNDQPRILIADDVGVGKTIEAGLILKEMEARSGIKSVLIICPKPLVVEHKWKEEMKRFDEEFEEVDGAFLTRLINDTDRDGDWPDKYSKVIIPYSIFNEPSVSGTVDHGKDTAKSIGLENITELLHFDLVIVDEAHHIRNSSTWAHRAVKAFCENAGAVVFLSATPLQNKTDDLFNLLNLLRPDIVYDRDVFNTMAEPNQYINCMASAVRSQSEGWQEIAKDMMAAALNTTYGRSVIQHNPDLDIVMEYLQKNNMTREEKIMLISKIEGLHTFANIISRTRRRDIENFCIRRTITVNSCFNDTQASLYKDVIDFESKVLSRMHGTSNTRFMMCTIMRQASSCLYGLAPLLNDYVNRRIYEIGRDDGDYFDDYGISEDNVISISDLAERIKNLVASLPEDDPKFNKMYNEIILHKMNEDNNKIIIFSSFRHTLRYLYRKLSMLGVRVGQIDGSTPDEERRDLSFRFRAPREDESTIDVLLFTEVGCEGLDYQFCDTMINYDLPWNPMRIEQRIGRIDRRGQKSDTVKIYNMITDDTIDAVIYDRCLSKIGVFQSSIGDCSEILGKISDEITKIMFEPNLTEEERSLKIDKMADNEVLKVEEMRKLEQDEKALFGFDLSNYMMDKDVQNAENQWISAESTQRLVSMYLNDFLGEGEYIRGKSEQKSLRLPMDKRHKLLDELKNLPIVNKNRAVMMWAGYLKSQKQTKQVTFDSSCAKDNPETLFFTQMHPLVLQAAIYESQAFACEIGINVSDSTVPKGSYEFLVYSWEYIGVKNDVKLIPVCRNKLVEDNLMNFLQIGNGIEIVSKNHSDKWNLIEKLHYNRWNDAKEEYIKEVSEESLYREEQITQQYKAKLKMLERSWSLVEDERIKRMRLSQIEKEKINLAIQQKKYSDIVKRADIHTNILIKGVVNIL